MSDDSTGRPSEHWLLRWAKVIVPSLASIAVALIAKNTINTFEEHRKDAALAADQRRQEEAIRIEKAKVYAGIMEKQLQSYLTIKSDDPDKLVGMLEFIQATSNVDGLMNDSGGQGLQAVAPVGMNGIREWVGRQLQRLRELKSKEETRNALVSRLLAVQRSPKGRKPPGDDPQRKEEISSVYKLDGEIQRLRISTFVSEGERCGADRTGITNPAFLNDIARSGLVLPEELDTFCRENMSQRTTGEARWIVRRGSLAIPCSCRREAS